MSKWKPWDLSAVIEKVLNEAISDAFSYTLIDL